MGFEIDKRLQDLQPYKALTGNYPIRLDVNESFLPLPERILSKFIDEVRALPFNRYPDPYALDLIDAFCGFYGTKPDEVVAGNGSDELISLIIEGFISDNDKVLTLSPDFSMYAFYTSVRQGNVVRFDKNADYSVDLDALLSFVKKQKPKLIIFSNPCNPTGTIIKRQPLLRLLESLDCLVVVDEAYMDFADESIIDCVSLYKNLIVLRTLSKLGAAAAIRMGFAVSNVQITGVLKAVKSVYNTNALSQIMARLIYQDKDFLIESKNIIMKSKQYLFNQLCKIPSVLGAEFVPIASCANFVYIICNTSQQIYEALLKKGIAIRCFKDRLRINAGSDFENQELLKNLRLMI